MKTFLRVLIIGAILLILVLLSIGIVRLVPKALSSLASATVSINSLFGGSGSNATSTTNNTVVPNGNGFIVVGPNGTTTGNVSTNTNNSTSSVLDILKPNFGKYPLNNYVPTSGTPGLPNTTSGSNATAAQTCAANGAPNLAVSVIGKGVISNGQYIETNNFKSNDMVSIKFKVENRGTCPTGKWSLSTSLPSQNATDRQRNVTNVNALPAGAAVTGQANFDNPQPGNVTATFVVTDGSGRDTSSADNTATANLAVTNAGTIGGNNGTPIVGDGRPDLIVQVVQVGVLNYNNQFVPVVNNTFGPNDRVAIKFNVINQGQNSTGPWNFRAELSDYPVRTYNNSQYEAAIPAGGKATYTIAFDNIRAGSNTITLYVDSANQVAEFNESNNIATVNFNVTGTNYNYGTYYNNNGTYYNNGYPYQY